MGILYIDEAGNSGIKDSAQPNLIYGGPLVSPHHWKNVMAEYYKIEAKFKSKVYQKFNFPKKIPESFDKMNEQIGFLDKFHFHAAEIVNGKHLWGKLNINGKV